MKRDIDKGQNLDLCKTVTSETLAGTRVVYLDKGSSCDGDCGVLLKAGQHSSAVDWEDEDPGSHRNAFLRLAPLFWLDNKPVYIGDKVMHSNLGEIEIKGPARTVADRRAVAWAMDRMGHGDTVSIPFLSWPKQKFVKYLHLYSDGSMRTMDEAGEAPVMTGLNLAETCVIEWEA